MPRLYQLFDFTSNGVMVLSPQRKTNTSIRQRSWRAREARLSLGKLPYSSQAYFHQGLKGRYVLVTFERKHKLWKFLALEKSIVKDSVVCRRILSFYQPQTFSQHFFLSGFFFHISFNVCITETTVA